MKKPPKKAPAKKKSTRAIAKKATPKSGKKKAAVAVLEPTESLASSGMPVIGIVAPAGPAPEFELLTGAERLAAEGFPVYLHPQVKKQEAFFAGSDTDRSLAFLDYAFDPEIQVLWAARGGYGSIRILPILDEITEKVGMPEPKTFIGFSDATILSEYVRTRWGWRVVHAPMPGTQQFDRVQGKDWKELVGLLKKPGAPMKKKLKSYFRPQGFQKVQGELVGGNLSMIASVVGTPYEFDLQGKILFLEEVTEAPYRMDRMLHQLAFSGALAGVRAIVLGTFTQCEDSCPSVWARAPSKSKKSATPLKPMRKLMKEPQALDFIFGEMGRELGIPVFYGLEVGHGHGTGTLPLGMRAEIDAQGVLTV